MNGSRIYATFLLGCGMLLSPLSTQAASSIPRVIIALYDKEETETIKETNIHTLAEMPLNHLGLIVEYHNIHDPLPAISNRSDVRGVITWFSEETQMAYPERYIRWATEAMDAGKKFVVMEDFGFYEDNKNHDTPITSINYFLRKLGLSTEHYWINLTYDSQFTIKNPHLLNVRRPITDGLHPPYEHITRISEATDAHLVARKARMNGEAVLIATNKNGGFIADGYAFSFKDAENGQIRQWAINPFEFFRLSYATDNLPKPDTTTMAGRRIYYSHIDGDGFNNYADLEMYKSRSVLAGQAIMENVIKPFPDMPVTATAIAADLDPNWAAVPQSSMIAKTLFALPNVSIGTHTYSHPFAWSYFADGNWQKEEEVLDLYPHGSWKNKEKMERMKDFFIHKKKHIVNVSDDFPKNYDIPRAYANQPFDVNFEVAGSIAKLQEFAPPGKKVDILTWSGNCLPFEKALALTREAGVGNINAGDSRFDRDYPSYASVAPISLVVGKERQIYASTSNENTYIDLENQKYFGFKYLLYTNHNTESPIRLKPYGIYYHYFSGQNQASLNAIVENVTDAHDQPLTPLTTNNFASIAQGFFTTQLTPIDTNSWRIDHRGTLQTIRFDQATDKSVDFENSSGVIGQRHHQGSLYVYLDAADAAPVITTKAATTYYQAPFESSAYLIESRWKLWNLQQENGKIQYTTQGFGRGEMVWQVPENGRYLVEMHSVSNNDPKESSQSVIAVTDRLLRLNLPYSYNTPHNITVKRIIT